MKTRLAIIISFLVALLLAWMPLPHIAMWFRPIWVPLVLLYWVIVLPDRLGLGTALVLGFILDLFQGTLLGQHAFALLLITYIAMSGGRRIRVFPLLQQMLVIAGLLILYRFVLLWMQHLAGPFSVNALYWLPVLSSTLLWPWVVSILARYSVNSAP